MKKTFLFLFILLQSQIGETKSLHDSVKIKTACIVHFRIDSKNPGVSIDALTQPLYKQLKRVFKIDSIINIQQLTIQWTEGVYRLPEEKELTQAETDQAKNLSADLIFSIKVEHWLGSMLLAKGKKQVLLFTCTIFDRFGKRVWDVKKKDSCCRTLEVGTADYNENDYPIEVDEFLKLYQSVVQQAFGGF